MDSRPLAALLGAVGVVLAVAVMVVAGVGPFAADEAGGAVEPAVASFESGGGECVESVRVGGRTAVEESGGAYRVAFTGNVSVPDANWTLGNASVERRSPGEYVLAFERRENPGKAGRDCTAQAHYEAVVHVPADDETFALGVEVDGERVRTLRHGERGSGVESNASAGSDGSGGGGGNASDG
jgi:hypothetical protein